MHNYGSCSLREESGVGWGGQMGGLNMDLVPLVFHS